MAAAAQHRDVVYRVFRFPADLDDGTVLGVRPNDGGLVLGGPPSRLEYTDPHTGVRTRYDVGRWVSPPVRVGFGVHQVVPSWTADVPEGCWVQVEVCGWADDAAVTGWYVLARWAADDEGIRRTSVPGQQDRQAEVDTDTLTVTGARATGWQVRVTLARPAGTAVGPTLRTVGAVASGPRPTTTVPTQARAEETGTDADRTVPARTGPDGTERDAATGDPAARGRVLAVPTFSQRLHAGHYPRWGGGGDSWCSPTCVTMVLVYWGVGPTPEECAWVDPTDPRPEVDHAARHCYDHAYRGAGNWPFNTAYAGRYGMDAFVTRLRSLAEAERFIAAGVPLVVSAAFRTGDVPGLDYDTKGHLIVLVGFTSDGDPVLNDPYASDDTGVRRTVDRQRFEAAWQQGSSGVAYVIRPPSVPLPPPPAQPNW
ncbi:peptidase C39 family protein [Micromonospora sagamiensis]|uniref:Peptidase C39-like protein n=1 Tax=Micromonospora sagamiensis TaxID=47875 RepID=A0A562WJR9_9ACTN|nr:peptidase C39 family protein [Micromonospora sagamiensis]TWJ30549.1 peptidase C39-like protein [Micromonospora sagamiensis]BCL16420.1 membrane protein [Micromonospora sagamiensis]